MGDNILQSLSPTRLILVLALILTLGTVAILAGGKLEFLGITITGAAPPKDATTQKKADTQTKGTKFTTRQLLEYLAVNSESDHALAIYIREVTKGESKSTRSVLVSGEAASRIFGISADNKHRLEDVSISTLVKRLCERMTNCEEFAKDQARLEEEYQKGVSGVKVPSFARVPIILREDNRVYLPIIIRDVREREVFINDIKNTKKKIGKDNITRRDFVEYIIVYYQDLQVIRGSFVSFLNTSNERIVSQKYLKNLDMSVMRLRHESSNCSEGLNNCLTNVDRQIDKVNVKSAQLESCRSAEQMQKVKHASKQASLQDKIKNLEDRHKDSQAITEQIANFCRGLRSNEN